MARAIKSIPTLKADVAERFVDRMNAAAEQRSTVNFSKQVEAAHAILKKAKLK
ncbi:MAG: hypothetical protein RIC35_23940 [Marinoscillum sp.]